MFVECIFAIAMVVVYWYFNVRIATRHVPLPECSSIAEAQSCSWDYVVVGGGVSGAAAVAGIREGNPAASILLVEGGRTNEGSMVELPNYTMDLVGSEVDWLLRAGRPFAEEVAGSPVNSKPFINHPDVRNEKQGMKPYPRGRGFGGTQQLDHQLWFSPLSPSPESTAHWSRAEGWLARVLDTYRLVSLPVMRSPLSAVFGESAKRAKHGAAIQPYFPDPPTKGCITHATMSPNHVFPHYLFMDSARGTRPAVARFLLDDALSNSGSPKGAIKTLTGMSVVGFLQATVKGHHVVTKVLCRKTGMAHDMSPLEIAVNKAVVCCAGNFGSPKILAPLISGTRTRREQEAAVVPSATSASFPLVDVVAVPLMYQARPGLSDDPVRTQSFASIFAWYVARKGGLLQVVTDTSVLLASQAVPGASILITLFPCGGFSTRQRMTKMGFAPALGVFTDAFHFSIAVHTLPGLSSKSSASEQSSPLASFRYSANDEPTEQLRGSLFAGLSFAPLQNEVAESVTACLVEGVKFCRELVLLSPLADLTTGKEALDTSLFPTTESAPIFQVLYGKLAAIKAKDPKVVHLRKRAQELATSPEYLTAYVRRHARYSGYASGSLSSAVAVSSSRVVAKNAPGNLFIGDASAVSPRESLVCGIHNAGATSTAMLRGYAAGLEATSSV